MKYISIPKLKNPISRLIFGTAIDAMTSGKNADGILDTAFCNGINTFDTARVYGMSEFWANGYGHGRCVIKLISSQRAAITMINVKE